MRASLKGKTVLVTGGTGSIGAQLVREALRLGAAKVIVFSRDDSKQFYLQQELAGESRVAFLIGDVRDTASLARAFRQRVHLVLHAAALKHVAISEQNPTEAVKTNVIGTQNLVDLCIQHGVEKMVTISTDKAVNPSCTMGATKYLAERLTIAANMAGVRPGTAFACVRFGNVLGSRGSVIPAFHRSARLRNELVVSDPRVTRFAITIEEAAQLVLRAVAHASGGEVFVLKMGAFLLGDLAEIFPRAAGVRTARTRTVGLSPGEKRHEELATQEEMERVYENDEFYVILPAEGGDATRRRLGLRRAPSGRIQSDTAPRISKARLAQLVKRIVAQATV